MRILALLRVVLELPFGSSELESVVCDIRRSMVRERGLLGLLSVIFGVLLVCEQRSGWFTLAVLEGAAFTSNLLRMELVPVPQLIVRLTRPPLLFRCFVQLIRSVQLSNHLVDAILLHVDDAFVALAFGKGTLILLRCLHFRLALSLAFIVDDKASCIFMWHLTLLLTTAS